MSDNAASSSNSAEQQGRSLKRNVLSVRARGKSSIGFHNFRGPILCTSLLNIGGDDGAVGLYMISFS
jgi:hypothetical protein